MRDEFVHDQLQVARVLCPGIQIARKACGFDEPFADRGQALLVALNVVGEVEPVRQHLALAKDMEAQPIGTGQRLQRINPQRQPLAGEPAEPPAGDGFLDPAFHDFFERQGGLLCKKGLTAPNALVPRNRS